jgi:mono/diheme cytochrome c family protein
MKGVMMKRLALIVGISLFLIAAHHDLHAHDVKAGKKLYKQRCAHCHGMKGEVSEYGNNLKPFPAKDLRTNLLPDKEMKLTIKYGLYGRSMPGFSNTAVDPKTRAIEKKLTDDDVDDLMLYIRTLSYTPDIWHGKAVFKKVCTPCHVDPEGKKLTHASNLKKSTLSREEIAEVIRYGRHNKPMIARRDVLTNVDIADILSYVLSIRE